MESIAIEWRQGEGEYFLSTTRSHWNVIALHIFHLSIEREESENRWIEWNWNGCALTDYCWILFQRRWGDGNREINTQINIHNFASSGDFIRDYRCIVHSGSSFRSCILRPFNWYWGEDYAHRVVLHQLIADFDDFFTLSKQFFPWLIKSCRIHQIQINSEVPYQHATTYIKRQSIVHQMNVLRTNKWAIIQVFQCA